ncbi:hypothetical protein L226DRAFT_489352 [Lentinus tigrinus ALCF2SS1-7]|uniref:F-box domain-containing protein n=1 Tax=Lentinus tigrinus ALCF2SS1-6 TaxID=1328759 RepID=A0A5C2S1J5_9APHY|nr:hypothetical protein L227DRAFT_578164 [Lentinus tigrinus ALCF2SS1-6]RPD73087.1 hypothetical protein L226DRAFT_489352 [Lentinus tigrinus ALCF2SS1-7]
MSPQDTHDTPAASAMDGCPIEILGLIFTLACVDDGYTGRALSLVSKHIRGVSRKYAFQSIALYGSHQLSAFAALLERVDPQHGRVRNLYLADRRRVWMEYKPGQDKTSWIRARVTEDFHITDPAREYSSDAILSIFRRTAPTLRTLTLLLFDRYDEMALSMPFPALQELTIYGSLLNHHGNAEIPQCGALQRLHIVQDFSLRKSVPRAVSIVAPSLTHLRISRLVSSGLGSGDIVHGLERMLQQPEDAASTVFPPSLKHIFIQMSQQEVFDCDGKVQLKDLAMRDAGKRVTLLKPHLWNPADSFTGRDTDVEYYMSIKVQWERRNAGLEGIWDVKQSDILASYEYCAEENRP